MFCPDNGPNADYNANGTIKFTASEKVSIKITCPEADLLAMLDNVLNGEYNSSTKLKLLKDSANLKRVVLHPVSDYCPFQTP